MAPATNAVVALVTGLVVAVLLFVPVAAVQYRRDGRLGPVDLTVLLAAAVYAMSLWTYTLLPLPTIPLEHCAGTQTTPFGSLADIRAAADAGAGLLHNTALLQVVLNVVLFVPLGALCRVITHRGILVATLTGLVVSLLIETTQLTGVWGIYPCAYRVFDVDDLITNTAGALLGAAFSWPVTLRRRRRRGLREPLPQRISLGRRWAGAVSDAVFCAVLGIGGVVAYELAAVRLSGSLPTPSVGIRLSLLWGFPLVVEAVTVLALGKTIGELAVDLRTVPASVPRRAAKLVTGVGLVLALPWVSGAFGAAHLGTLVAAAYGLVSVVAMVPGQDHPGLSHRLARLRLEVDVEDAGSRATSSSARGETR